MFAVFESKTNFPMGTIKYIASHTMFHVRDDVQRASLPLRYKTPPGSTQDPDAKHRVPEFH